MMYLMDFPSLSSLKEEMHSGDTETLRERSISVHAISRRLHRCRIAYVGAVGGAGGEIMVIGVMEGHWEHTLIETINTTIGPSAYRACQGTPKGDRAYHDVGL